MIIIDEKKDCCGCTACVEICPKGCIDFLADEEGFRYPKVNTDECINCSLCEKSCPVINRPIQSLPKKVIAAQNIDNRVRINSSSGGVFSFLAEIVIKDGGVVFGAAFDKRWNVNHTFTDSLEGLFPFRGSKYVQSNIGESYKQCKSFLQAGKKVLFSGTPCQIAGLRTYLRKNYENLITIDVICHGVPSPAVWSEYKNTVCPKGIDGENSVSSLKKKPVLTGIFFRDKRAGWRKYGFSAWEGATGRSDENTVFPPKHSKRRLYEIQQENIFLRGFLQNLYLRPSCHSCQFRDYHSGSDVTLADFWGVERLFPSIDDDKGTSLVIIKNERIIPMLIRGGLFVREIKESDYTIAFNGNSSLFTDDKPSPNREQFFIEFYKNPTHIDKLVLKYTDYPVNLSRKNKLDHILMSVGLYGIVKYLITLARKLL